MKQNVLFLTVAISVLFQGKIISRNTQKLYYDYPFAPSEGFGRRIVPAGSMWGYHIRGIRQDVYLVALPKIHIEDVFIKPLVSKNILELEITIVNGVKTEEEHHYELDPQQEKVISFESDKNISGEISFVSKYKSKTINY